MNKITFQERIFSVKNGVKTPVFFVIGHNNQNLGSIAYYDEIEEYIYLPKNIKFMGAGFMSTIAQKCLEEHDKLMSKVEKKEGDLK